MEELLAKYFSGDASRDERTLVESWRSQSKENAQTFFDSKSLWIESAQFEAQRPDVLASILGEKTEKKGLHYFLIHHSWPKYAAAAVLLLALGLLFMLNQTSPNFNVQSLADGSEISVHGNAMIEIVAMNEHVREVKLLNGKAYFDIKRDESRPFLIHTENAIVKVLGTSFLINAESSDTEVCVESGLVELIKADGKLSVKLQKGEMGHISNAIKGIIKKPNDNPNYLAWKTKVLTFKNSEMSEVKQVLEEVYGIEVELDHTSFKNCKLTAKISKKKAKDALEIIARTFDIAYEIRDNKAVLKGAGC